MVGRLSFSVFGSAITDLALRSSSTTHPYSLQVGRRRAIFAVCTLYGAHASALPMLEYSIRIARGQCILCQFVCAPELKNAIQLEVYVGRGKKKKSGRSSNEVAKEAAIKNSSHEFCFNSKDLSFLVGFYILCRVQLAITTRLKSPS